MTPEELNTLFHTKNLTEVLSYTLCGLSILKERYKLERLDDKIYGQDPYDGLSRAENYAKRYLIELNN